MKKSLGFISLFLFGAVLLLSYLLFFNNVINRDQAFSLEIRPTDTWKELEKKIEENNLLKNNLSFKIVKSIATIKSNVIKPGRYLINNGMSNYDIAKKLVAGSQDPVLLVINNVRDIYQLAAKLDSYLMLDSTEIIHFISDTTFLDSLGYTMDNIMTMILPDSYEVFWTISVKNLLSKLKSHHDAYWESESNLILLSDLGLNEKEVYILASIVEKETQFEKERSTIAGVYWNRLNKGMKLQADPTAVFASGQIGVHRVSHEILSIESPYNTYMVIGLPPGPIYMPSMNSIKAVLNVDKHEYIFFCALPGYEGKHSFAKTADQHFENARLYRKWLDEQNIH